jgi:hypothetical protein
VTINCIVNSVPAERHIQRVHRRLGPPLPATLLCCSRTQHEACGTVCLSAVHIPEEQWSPAAQNDLRWPQPRGAPVWTGVSHTALQNAQDYRYVLCRYGLVLLIQLFRMHKTIVTCCTDVWTAVAHTAPQNAQVHSKVLYRCVDCCRSHCSSECIGS